MYLLEHLRTKLTGEKWSLARQLMYRPWCCDLALLKENIPHEVFARFEKVQRHCNALIKPEGKKPLLKLQFHYIELRAFVIVSPRQALPAELRLIEMQESFVGQAIEDLAKEGFSFQSLSQQGQAAFISLYALAYLCIWILAGVFVPHNQLIHYKLVDDEQIEEAIRLYWFGHHWSFQSNVADFSMRELIHKELHSLGDSIEHAVAVRVPAFVYFVENTLDKYISFHGSFATLIYSVDKARYTAMYRRAELICYLYLKCQEHVRALSASDVMAANRTALPHEYDMTLVYRAGFSENELSELIKESENAGEGEALIIRSSPDTIRMGLLGLKYALISYLRPMLTAMEKRGDWFDKRYIPRYLQERIGVSRYRFGQEVTAKSEKEGKYDIDLIVADESIERLYFCQVKHRISTLLPYFRDEFDEYMKNKQLNHAVNQLQGAKPQFENPTFLKKIRMALKNAGVSPQFLEKIDGNFLKENVGYIVIHTIENLDFALKDGIAFYEWNTFRNLLREQITTYTQDDMKAMNLDLAGVPLDDPNRLSSVLMTLIGNQKQDNPLHPGRQWLFAMNTYLKLKEAWSIKIGRQRLFDIKGANLSFPIL